MKRYKPGVFLAAIIIITATSAFKHPQKFFLYSHVNNGDSVSFTPNTADGWDVFSSYLHQDTPDSVDFELILKHDQNIDWKNERLIGTITDPNFIPANQQIITYYLLPGNTWTIHIKKDGTVFFQTIHGFTPPDNLFIIPIKVRYKNN